MSGQGKGPRNYSSNHRGGNKYGNNRGISHNQQRGQRGLPRYPPFSERQESSGRRPPDVESEPNNLERDEYVSGGNRSGTSNNAQLHSSRKSQRGVCTFSPGVSRDTDKESIGKLNDVKMTTPSLTNDIEEDRNIQGNTQSTEDNLRRADVSRLDSFLVNTKSGVFACSQNLPDLNQSEQSHWDNTMDTDANKTSCIKEICGDLFKAPVNVSLVHCVGADLRMGSGIAVQFQNQFQSIGELFDQNPRPGGLVYITRDERCIFYLITKQRSLDKPTKKRMRSSLCALYDKCKELHITDLAMPQIGCGLDGLEWPEVKQMIKEIFQNGITITIYNLDEGSINIQPRVVKSQVKIGRKFLNDIEQETWLLYIGYENSFVSEEMKLIHKRIPFLDDIKSRKQKFQLGSAFRSNNQNDRIYGLICKKSEKSDLSYQDLEKAIQDLKELTKRERGFMYFGIQAFEVKGDPFAMDKINTLFRNSCMKAEFWICWPPTLTQMCLPDQKPYSNTEYQPTRYPEQSNFVNKPKDFNSHNCESEVPDDWENSEIHLQHNNASFTDMEQKMSGQSLVDATYGNEDEESYDMHTDDAQATTDYQDYVNAERERTKKKNEEIEKNRQQSRLERFSLGRKSCITEQTGDLFTADKTVSLAHCVGADFRMGSGIAVLFRQTFRSVDELLNQRVSQGGVAYITHNERYIFYLVTKQESTGKPTYDTLSRSLHALHDKCKELKVTKLAMPRIGCGLDRLSWNQVKTMLEEIFADGFSISIYNLEKPTSSYATSSVEGTYSRKPDNYRLADTVHEMRRLMESMERKLENFEGTAKEIQDLREDMKFHKSEADKCCLEHQSMKQKLETTSNRVTELERTVELLKQHLGREEVHPVPTTTFPTFGRGRGFRINYNNQMNRDYLHLNNRPPPPTQGALLPKAFLPNPGFYRPRMHITNHTMTNNDRYNVSGLQHNVPLLTVPQFPDEKQMLLRAAQQVVQNYNWLSAIECNGIIYIQKDQDSEPEVIYNYDDLKRL